MSFFTLLSQLIQAQVHGVIVFLSLLSQRPPVRSHCHSLLFESAGKGSGAGSLSFFTLLSQLVKADSIG